MKVLFLSAPFRYYQGGSEWQYSLIEEYITRRGFEVHYLFRSRRPVPEENCHTYSYLLRRKYNRYVFSDARRIYSMIRDIRPDVIYKRGINYISATGLSYARRHGAGYVQHIANSHDVGLQMPSGSPLKRWFDAALNRYVIRRADRVVAQARYQDEAMRSNYGRSADLVLPNVIPVPEGGTEKPGGVRVVWIANLKPQKRPELFVRLAGALGDTPAGFVMAGRDPGTSWSAGVMAMMEGLHNIEYTGELTAEQVSDLLRDSHVFVNTSIHEGFPNTYLQAAANRMPLVALEVDPDGMIEENDLGFHSRTFDQMVKDTGALVRDSELRKRKGGNAYRYVSENHGLSCLDLLTDLFRELSP